MKLKSIFLQALFMVVCLLPGTIYAETLGTNTILPTTGNAADLIFGSKYNLDKSALIETISFYAVASGNVKVAIYNDDSDAPDSRIVQSSGDSVTAGWNEIDITDQYLSPGDYWLMILTDTANIAKYGTGSTNQRAYKTGQPYADGFPSSFGTPTGRGGYIYSIYCSYGTYITLDETADSLMDRRVVAYDDNEQGDISLSGLCQYDFGTPAHIQAQIFNRTTTNTVQVAGNDWNTLTDESITDEEWSGTLENIPKTNAWLGIRVRLSDSTGVVYTGDNKIGVGYVVAYTGQSYIGYWTLYGPYTPTDLETSNDLCSKFRHSDSTRPSCDSNSNSVTVPFEGWELNTGDGSIIFANKLQSELDCPIGVLDYGHGGAAILAANKQSDNGYWLGGTSATENWFEDFEDALDVSEPMNRRKVNAIMWYHGYTDCDAGISYQDYYDAMEDLFGYFRTAVNFSTCPIFVVAQPRAANSTGNDDSFTNVRLAQYDICMDDNETKNIFAGQSVDLALHTDNVHLSESAQEAEALRYAQSVLWFEGVDGYTYHRGPHNIMWKIQNNTTTLVYLSHDGGTDFTPASSIDSYQVYTGSWISATGARTAANQITITHDSGTVTNVRCLYGRAPSITNIVKDNTSLTLPIEALGDFTTLGTQGKQIY